MPAPGRMASTCRASSAQRKSPSTKRPVSSMKKQRSASPSKAMPRSAPSDRTASQIARRFSSSSGFGSWSGNAPSGCQNVRTRSRPGSSSSTGPIVWAAMPLPPSSTTRSGRSAAGSTNVRSRAWYAGAMSTRSTEPPPGASSGRPSAPGGGAPADPRLARERAPALADELRAGVGARVVRRGAHEPAVQPVRADEEVEHLRAHQPRVQHVRALRHHAVAVAVGELRRAEAHVAAQADAEVAGRLVAQAAQHPGEGTPDLLGEIAVDLVAEQAADVVRLEDPRGGAERHARSGYVPYPPPPCSP